MQADHVFRTFRKIYTTLPQFSGVFVNKFWLTCRRARNCENTEKYRITKSTRVRRLFAHLKYRRSFPCLKTVSRSARRKIRGMFGEDGRGWLGRADGVNRQRRMRGGASGRTRVPRRRVPGLHRMGFNLCPVSRSAKWNLFASLCGATRFCAAPPRRLTRNYI